MILCLWPPLHPFSKLLAIQDHAQNLEEQLWMGGGGRSVFYLTDLWLASSDLKQDRLFFRESVSTFLQLVVATLIRGGGGSQAQAHGQAIYAKIQYSVSCTFATGCSYTTLDSMSAGTYFLSNWAWNRSITSSWNQNSWRHTTCRLGVWLAMRSTIARNLGTYKLGLELSHWPHHPLKYNEIITWFHQKQ